MGIGWRQNTKYMKKITRRKRTNEKEIVLLKIKPEIPRNDLYNCNNKHLQKWTSGDKSFGT